MYPQVIHIRLIEAKTEQVRLCGVSPESPGKVRPDDARKRNIIPELSPELPTVGVVGMTGARPLSRGETYRSHLHVSQSGTLHALAYAYRAV